MDIANGMAAVVSGGASGLGAATARRLAAAGARVAVLDMALGAAQAVAADIGGLALECDVASEAAAERALAAAAEAHGPARILVNCAGISESRPMVGRDGPAPLDDNERGVIVNTASIAGYDGPPGAVSYAAAKAGIAAMTLPMAQGLREDYVAALRSEIPFPPRLGQPDEFAALVEVIAANPMLNGEVIRLDAAYRMRD